MRDTVELGYVEKSDIPQAVLTKYIKEIKIKSLKLADCKHVTLPYLYGVVHEHEHT